MIVEDRSSKSNPNAGSNSSKCVYVDLDQIRLPPSHSTTTESRIHDENEDEDEYQDEPPIDDEMGEALDEQDRAPQTRKNDLQASALERMRKGIEKEIESHSSLKETRQVASIPGNIDLRRSIIRFATDHRTRHTRIGGHGMNQTFRGRYRRSDILQNQESSLEDRAGLYIESLIVRKISMAGFPIERCESSISQAYPMIEGCADGILNGFCTYPVPIEIKFRIHKSRIGPDHVNGEDILQCVTHCMAYGSPFCVLYEWSMHGDTHYMSLVHMPSMGIVQRIVNVANDMIAERQVDKESYRSLLKDLVDSRHISTVFHAIRTSSSPLHYDVKVAKDRKFLALNAIQLRDFINYMVM